MKQPFPDETQLIDDYKCSPYDSMSQTDDFYCVATIAIDYHSQLKFILLDYFSSTETNSDYQSIFSKYDSHTEKQTKYIIEGDPEKSKLLFGMAFMCMTHDNCAFEELKKFHSIELPRTDQRMKILQELNAIMNKPLSGKNSSNLICLDDHDQIVNCKSEEHYCVISGGLTSFSKRYCSDSKQQSSALFRYSLFTENDEDISSPIVQIQSKLFGLCRPNYCNDQKTAQKVHELVNYLVDLSDYIDSDALTLSSTNSTSPKSNAEKAMASTPQKSNGVRASTLCYLHFLVGFFLVIRVIVDNICSI